MPRRPLLTLPLLAARARAAPARAAPHRLEGGVGAGPARARRMQARLGIPVRAMPQDRVAALDAGHLELALLNGAELAEAKRRMGPRLVVLPGHVEGRTPVTRRVLPAALRTRLAQAVADTRA